MVWTHSGSHLLPYSQKKLQSWLFLAITQKSYAQFVKVLPLGDLKQTTFRSYLRAWRQFYPLDQTSWYAEWSPFVSLDLCPLFCGHMFKERKGMGKSKKRQNPATSCCHWDPALKPPCLLCPWDIAGANLPALTDISETASAAPFIIVAQQGTTGVQHLYHQKTPCAARSWVPAMQNECRIGPFKTF